MNNLRLFWYDSETTGLNEKDHQMLSFAMVSTDINLNILSKFETKLRLLPHVMPDPQALKTNNIDPTSLDWFSSSKEENESINEFVNFYDSQKSDYNYWLAFNAPFDNKFLFYALIRNSLLINLDNATCVDPLILAKEGTSKNILSTVQKKSKDGRFYRSSTLQDVASLLGTKNEGDAHNAMNDVLTMLKTTPKMVEKVLNQDMLSFLNNPKYHTEKDKFKNLVVKP